MTFWPLAALRGVLNALPPARAVALGAVCGRLAVGLVSGRARIARINLALAFPNASEALRESILRASFENLGRTAVEIALLQGRHREALLEALEVEGLENLVAAEAASETGGVLILTAHLGSWDLCGAAMAGRGHRLSVVHHGFASSTLEAMMLEARDGGAAKDTRGGENARSPGLEQLRMGRSAIGGVLRALREGRKVVVLLDQDADRDEGLFAPFFGQLACTRSGPASIAMRRRVPVLPAFVLRQADPMKHVLRIEPPLELEPAPVDGDEAALARAVAINVARMNEAIERAVRGAPEQWIWLHRRFRTRPAPERDNVQSMRIYPSRSGNLRRFRRWLREHAG